MSPGRKNGRFTFGKNSVANVPSSPLRANNDSFLSASKLESVTNRLLSPPGFKYVESQVTNSRQVAQQRASAQISLHSSAIQMPYSTKSRAVMTARGRPGR